MKKYKAYRLFLLWDDLQGKYNKKGLIEKATQCFWQKTRIVTLYDLE